MYIPVEYDNDVRDNSLAEHLKNIASKFPDDQSEDSNYFMSELNFHEAWNVSPFDTKEELAQKYSSLPIRDLYNIYQSIDSKDHEAANRFLENQVMHSGSYSRVDTNPIHDNIMTKLQDDVYNQSGISMSEPQLRASIIRHYMSDVKIHNEKSASSTLGGLAYYPATILADTMANFGTGHTLTGVASTAGLIGSAVGGGLIGSRIATWVGEGLLGGAASYLGGVIGNAGAQTLYGKAENEYGINPMRRELGLPDQKAPSLESNLLATMLFEGGIAALSSKAVMGGALGSLAYGYAYVHSGMSTVLDTLKDKFEGSSAQSLLNSLKTTASSFAGEGTVIGNSTKAASQFIKDKVHQALALKWSSLKTKINEDGEVVPLTTRDILAKLNPMNLLDSGAKLYSRFKSLISFGKDATKQTYDNLKEGFKDSKFNTDILNSKTAENIKAGSSIIADKTLQTFKALKNKDIKFSDVNDRLHTIKDDFSNLKPYLDKQLVRFKDSSFKDKMQGLSDEMSKLKPYATKGFENLESFKAIGGVKAKELAYRAQNIMVDMKSLSDDFISYSKNKLRENSPDTADKLEALSMRAGELKDKVRRMNNELSIHAQKFASEVDEKLHVKENLSALKDSLSDAYNSETGEKIRSKIEPVINRGSLILSNLKNKDITFNDINDRLLAIKDDLYKLKPLLDKGLDKLKKFEGDIDLKTRFSKLNESIKKIEPLANTRFEDFEGFKSVAKDKAREYSYRAQDIMDSVTALSKELIETTRSNLDGKGTELFYKTRDIAYKSNLIREKAEALNNELSKFRDVMTPIVKDVSDKAGEVYKTSVDKIKATEYGDKILNTDYIQKFKDLATFTKNVHIAIMRFGELDPVRRMNVVRYADALYKAQMRGLGEVTRHRISNTLLKLKNIGRDKEGIDTIIDNYNAEFKKLNVEPSVEWKKVVTIRDELDKHIKSLKEYSESLSNSIEGLAKLAEKGFPTIKNLLVKGYGKNKDLDKDIDDLEKEKDSLKDMISSTMEDISVEDKKFLLDKPKKDDNNNDVSN